MASEFYPLALLCERRFAIWHCACLQNDEQMGVNL